MKNTRRFASVATAALLAACVAVPMTSAFSASAAANNTIVISGYNTTENNDTGTHTYEAYQVFSGQYAGGILGNIVWGTGVDGDAILTDLRKASAETGNALYGLFPAESVKSAKDVAEKLGEITAIDDARTKAFAKIVGTHLTGTPSTSVNGKITNLDDGYYLVQDASTSPNGTPGDQNSGAKTRFILNVVGGGEVTVQAKSSAPSVVKKVQENTEVSSDYTYSYLDENGETISQTDDNYNDVADYNIGDAVPFKLYGTMPSTLDDYKTYTYTFNDTLGKEFTAPAKKDIKVTCDGVDVTAQATITVTDGSGTAASTVLVSFADVKKLTDVTVTKDSVVTVEYTAVLSSAAVIGLDGQENKVSLSYSNNPNANGEGTFGTTPEDKVIVFTYELDVTKYLGDKNTTANTKDGTKAGFKLKSAAKNKWAVVDTDNKITGWVENESDATEVTTGADGVFKFIGLDDGTYTLKETTTPTGYNTMADLELIVDATTVNTQTWTGAAGDALTAIKLTMNNQEKQGNIENGTVSGEIINQKGSSLPSTGGIGTTIFYVAGGILVAGAGVTLIAKKRMSKKEEA